ncbi:MAG: hypothetical protein AUK03_05880 [Anaerolineae bacterium CG2_30_64_16]|nr:MAG: hypothetical protein AUK03_05880 [Anaerolineae bacterium CG2_30_64_16]
MGLRLWAAREMWNVPYFVALLHPVLHRVSLYEAIAMQAIGLVGESLILWSLPGGHPAVGETLARFIAFDGQARSSWRWRYGSREPREDALQGRPDHQTPN